MTTSKNFFCCKSYRAATKDIQTSFGQLGVNTTSFDLAICHLHMMLKELGVVLMVAAA